jgi:dienelactone hydrolase
MIARFFHRWEQRLADVSRNDRVVRPFEWGLDWLDTASTRLRPVESLRGAPSVVEGRQGYGGQAGTGGQADDESRASITAWVDDVMRDSDAFFTPQPTRDYRLIPASPAAQAGGEAGTLTFPSGLTTPHADNNLVRARFFPANPIRKPRDGGPPARRAVVVLAQWNSDADGHVGLCRLLSRLGIASLRISLPYHDLRMPPELTRADYIVSSNVVRTVQVCRQAVLDVRLALWWLRDQGYDRLGLLGTSLGSCLAMLTSSHEPLVGAQALNHVSPFFADVVWRGLSTEHVRKGLDGRVDLDTLRQLWRPISPWSYLDRINGKKTLLVYAKYDRTFPVDLSLQLVEEWRRRDRALRVAVLPCGHYSTGRAPFKYLDGWYLGHFLARHL